MKSCKLRVRGEVCGDRAPFTGEFRRSEYDDIELEPLCSEHAYDALERGTEVYGPNGWRCRIEDDGSGEIAEVPR